MRAVLGIWLAVAACFSPTLPEGAACGAPGDCPGGLLCDPGSATCRNSCSEGFSASDGTCLDDDECAASPCGADATCTNSPGSFACACNPGFAGDGQSCTRVCSSVLIYDDCIGPDDADCATLEESQFSDQAAEGLGMTVQYSRGDQVAFRGLFDAGGYELVIFESSLSDIDAETADRVAAWIDGGGRAIVSFWDLDNATTGATLRSAVRVTTGADVTNPRPVLPDPAASVDVFDKLVTVPTPLTFSNLMADDGDLLTLADGGEILARHDRADGEGAIALTRDGKVLTLGFVPIGMVFPQPRDDDGNDVPDVQQLYTNLIGQVCGY